MRDGTLQSNGQSATGSASCSARRPSPTARTATAGSASHRGATALSPGSARVTIHSCVSSSADLEHVRDPRVAPRPLEAQRFVGERRLRVARTELDVALVVGAERQPAVVVPPDRREADSAGQSPGRARAPRGPPPVSTRHASRASRSTSAWLRSGSWDANTRVTTGCCAISSRRTASAAADGPASSAR